MPWEAAQVFQSLEVGIWVGGQVAKARRHQPVGHGVDRRERQHQEGASCWVVEVQQGRYGGPDVQEGRRATKQVGWGPWRVVPEVQQV